MAQSIDRCFEQDNPWIAQIHTLCITLTLVHVYAWMQIYMYDKERKLNSIHDLPIIIFALARFHLGFQNTPVVNNRWHQIFLWLVASTSVNYCELGKC